MRRSIFADVHVNGPALRAVLEDAGHWDESVFLGDIFGWGPHPKQCADLYLCGYSHHGIERV